MVDKFGSGRVFVAGGETTTYLSRSLIDIYNFRRRSPVCRLYFLRRLSLTLLLSVHSPTGGQGLNTSVQDAVCIFE
jgi:hypothetical protein